MAHEGHARFSASESHRWMGCAGSVEASDDAPRYPSAAATQGTAAHRLGYLIMKGSYDEFTSGPPVGTEFDFEDDGEIKTAVVDAEMKTAVYEHVDHVMDLLVKDPGSKLLLEEPVTLVEGESYGTADVVILGMAEPRVLTVIDYKHGFSPVRIGTATYPNTQLMTYAAGALLKFDPKCTKFAIIRIEVVQPRCFEVPTVQSLELDVHDVMDWFKYTFMPALEAARTPGAPRTPGDHCTWCPAMSRCPATLAKANELAGADFAAVARPALPAVASLTDKQVMNILRWTPLLDGFVREVQERAFQELQGGKAIPGYKLVRKKSNRRWPDGSDAHIASLLSAAGLRSPDIYEAPSLLSPAQIEKRLGKAGKTAVAKVAVKPEGGVTMTTDDDPRPAIGVANSAAEDFGDFGKKEAEDLI